MTKLSIIIPVWNQEKLVLRALDSIPRRDDIEVLVWDDGSKDDTRANLERYKAEHPELRLSVFGDKVNHGCSYAKNQLLDKIKGEYFTLIDSDDYLLTENYEKAMAEMDGTDIICFDCEVNNGNVWPLTEEYLHTYVATWSRFLRRDKFGDLRFREDRKVDQDWWFNEECLKRNPVHKYTRIPAYHYNFPRAGSLVDVQIKRNKEGERMLKNVFYFSHLNPIGGVETMLYQVAKKYGKTHDITMVYRTGSKDTADRLSEYVRVHQLKSGEKLSCEKLFIAYSTDILNQCAADEVYFIVHGDYVALKGMPPVNPKIDHYIGVSEHVCKMFTQLTGLPCEVCYNPFEVVKPKKVLTLVTASRLTVEKGKKRMEILAKALDAAKIPYIWFVYTNDKEAIDNPSIIYRKQRYDVLDYVAKADYLVQLSDTEGFSYSITEALSVGTPVIVTDLPMCEEMGVINGKTGFILPFDMSEIPVDAIYKGLRKPKWTPRKDRYDVLLAEGESNYVYEQQKEIEIRVKTPYWDMQRDRMTVPGEVLSETKERAGKIVDMGLARFE